MPRSSRHKSSKHSSREGRDYSDSEKDSGLKERKGKEESVSHRLSREYASGEKRKYESKPVDGKDVSAAVKGDYVEEYGGSSSKKRKEKVDDDRWTGGDADERESLKADKDLKGLSESKSRSRRGNEISGRAVDVDEVKKSGGSKGDSKHHRSERKERSEKEGGLERDRKSKEYSTTDRFVDGEVAIDIVGIEGSRKKAVPLDDGAGKHISSNSGIVPLDERRNPDHDRELERRLRRKDSSNDVDTYLDGKEADDRRQSSRSEAVKSGKYKDDGHKDDRYKDKYGEDLVKDSRSQDEKQQHRDGRHAREYASGRSDEKYARNEKKDLDVQQKKSKPPESDRDHVRSRHHDDRDRDDRKRDFDRDDRDGDHDGGRELDKDRGRDLDHDRGRDRDRDRARDLDRDRDRGRERYHREHDREHDRDYTSHLDERSSRYKEDRSRKRSPDDYDDYYNDKAKNVKADPHADREKSVSRKTHSEAVAGSTRGKISPSTRSHMIADKYRDNTHDDSKYGDSRQVLATPDKSSKYPAFDKNPKLEDNHRVRDPSVERSPRKKASPFVGLLEKSPSSTSFDRKFTNRSDRRRSLDVDEAERRSSGSNNVKDGSINDDRQSKDLSPKKSLAEEHSPVESSFHRKSGQGNGPFLGHGPSSYKAGANSPLVGSMGEDSRGHNNRYRRSVDPNPGRAHGNLWKGVPNWPNPLQTGFMPFPPGPHGPHGVFPSVLPQFSSPPIFGVRPPMEMNHSGIPYHLPDSERFANHMRPLGWQNMVDSTGPSHFPGWDANNGIFRDESSMYGPGCIPNGRVRETNADMWKPNGDVKLEAGIGKDGHSTDDPMDDAHVSHGAQGLHTDNYQNEELGTMKTPNGAPINEALVTTTEVDDEKVPESPAVDDDPKSLRAYLSGLDISVELTDPDLYNEFVSLAVIEQSGNFEEMEDVNMGMSKVVGSEIANITTDVSLFPAAEDSIFQRAMDLFKTHNMDRRSFHIFDGNSPPIASEVEVMEQAQEGEEGMEKEIDEPVHYQEEIQGPPVEEPSSDNAQIEPMETMTLPISSSEADNESSLCSDMEVKETAATEDMPPKLTSADVLNSNANDAEMSVAEDDNGNIEPAPCVVEQLGSEVSGPLNLPHGSVKVCEGLMPVSNEYESESVTLTRVHDAPESTH